MSACVGWYPSLWQLSTEQGNLMAESARPTFVIVDAYAEIVYMGETEEDATKHLQLHITGQNKYNDVVTHDYLIMPDQVANFGRMAELAHAEFDLAPNTLKNGDNT